MVVLLGGGVMRLCAILDSGALLKLYVLAGHYLSAYAIAAGVLAAARTYRDTAGFARTSLPLLPFAFIGSSIVGALSGASDLGVPWIGDLAGESGLLSTGLGLLVRTFFVGIALWLYEQIVAADLSNGRPTNPGLSLLVFLWSKLRLPLAKHNPQSLVVMEKNNVE